MFEHEARTCDWTPTFEFSYQFTAWVEVAHALLFFSLEDWQILLPKELQK